MLTTTARYGLRGFVSAMGKVYELNDLHPLDCPFVAQVRLEWAEYDWYYDKGYIRYYDGWLALRREHQLVADLAYGLPNGYHVHHIDHDRLNNRAINLAIMSQIEHAQLHGQIQVEDRPICTCIVCGNAFAIKPSELAKRANLYCSVKCEGLARRKVDWPSREYLANLLVSIRNWSEIGRIFGVSDNAVRNWARAYGLDLSVCDGRIRR